MPADSNTKTAIYWDFENIHLSVSSLLEEKNELFKPVKPLVRVDLIMEYVAGLGPIAVNRAYGNWQWYGKYGQAILRHSIQAVQLFPAGRNAKNGADIRMAVDILDDLQRFSSIGTVVIVSGDVDFVAVAQRVRQAGLEVIGVGTANSSNKFWIASCSQFKQYGTLLPHVGGAEATAAERKLQATTTDNPASLLVAAVRTVQRFRETDWVGLVDVKPAMLRLDPGFDQVAYGEVKFINFVRRFPELVELRQLEATLPEIRLRAGAEDLAEEKGAELGAADVDPAEYLRAGFRPFDLAYLDDAAAAAVAMAQSGDTYPDPAAVKAVLGEHLPADQVDGYYDLLRRTSAVVRGGEGMHVPPALDTRAAARVQILGGLLGYLDEATPEPLSPEEFAGVLGGGEALAEEVGDLPAPAELPVPIAAYGKAKPTPKPPRTTSANGVPAAASPAAALVRRRGIFVPTPAQLDEAAAFLAEAAREGDVFSGPEDVTDELAALETVSGEEAPRLYKNIFTAHCFVRGAGTLSVHPNLVRPEAVRQQVLGRLLAYLDFTSEEPIDRVDFARLFGDGEELVAEMEALPPESGLPVPIRR